MHLLYLDDAGSAPNPAEEYLVLGGVSISEAQVHWITSQLDDLAKDIHPDNPHQVEFHASEIFARRSKPWRDMHRDEAIGVIKAVLKVLVDAYDSAKAFACAVEKKSFSPADPMEIAFEELCNRFDLMLTRLRSQGDRHRGLIILDESSYETTLQQLAQGFRIQGTKWRNIHNLADTPMFVDSRLSRVVQLADHVAYAVFRRYNAGDTSYFDIIASQFDQEDGRLHGLVHKHSALASCMCPACMSRR